MNLLTTQKKTHRLENKLIVNREDTVEVNQEFGFSRYIQLCLKYMNNKDCISQGSIFSILK